MSPFVAAAVRASAGCLHWVEALRTYFARGLQRFPDLAFYDARVFVGTGSLTITYASHFGARTHSAAETMVIGPDGRALTVFCHYEQRS